MYEIEFMIMPQGAWTTIYTLLYEILERTKGKIKIKKRFCKRI